VLRVEFTVEPFVEGRPGPHVTEAVAAVEAAGVVVDVGPFGSSFDVQADEVGAVVGALVAAAYGGGATHLQLHIGPVGAVQETER
jgi:uncharacterized protein YqgV (UPF0045/DUF77 family)